MKMLTDRTLCQIWQVTKNSTDAIFSKSEQIRVDLSYANQTQRPMYFLTIEFIDAETTHE